MQALGYFVGAVEAVELDALEGAQGLKALRVTVQMEDGNHPQALMQPEIEEIVESLHG